MECRQCGAHIEPDSLFCAGCGLPVPSSAADATAAGGGCCASCGKPLEPDTAFCPDCDTPGAAPQTERVDAPVSDARAEAPPSPPVLGDEAALDSTEDHAVAAKRSAGVGRLLFIGMGLLVLISAGGYLCYRNFDSIASLLGLGGPGLAPVQEAQSPVPAAEPPREGAPATEPAGPPSIADLVPTPPASSPTPVPAARPRPAASKKSPRKLQPAPPVVPARTMEPPAAPSGVSPAPPAPPVPPSPEPMRGGNVQEARLLRKVDPSYPPLAKRTRVQGSVTLQVSVDEKGNVSGVKILRGHPLLNDEAMRAVRQWKYSPTLLNGEPVPAIATVTVIFKLD